MSWTVRGSNPGTATFSTPIQVVPGALPASYKMGTGSFLGLKRPERGVNHHLLCSTEVIARAQLYIYFLSMSSRPVLGRNLPFDLNKEHDFETYFTMNSFVTATSESASENVSTLHESHLAVISNIFR
jgi:hypothetical protein